MGSHSGVKISHDEQQLIVKSKGEFVDSAIAAYMSTHKEKRDDYESPHPLLEPLPTLLTTMLQQSPVDTKRLVAVLQHAPRAFSQVSLPFSLLVHLHQTVPSYPLHQVIDLQPVHRLQIEIRYAVRLSCIPPRQSVLKLMMGSYLSRALPF